MAKKKAEAGKVTEDTIAEFNELNTTEVEEYAKEYHMWVTINNNSTGNVSVEIRQYGKPGNPNPPN